ncbi:aldehyde dehydrogenase [Desulfocucumis palustris]|uniref:3-sulfolactaldehyde dehydrogenase n=1 Tax=Desulfocucumis palustris TaxID=1898651 RepID=A0A2L2X8Y9_9FIRM|nr:aldehyde dehydrogenase family protein [Desulfocucumis palustris]GBF32384.1 aldehyde dehydrogenase [Desulfocucumis palustris]
MDTFKIYINGRWIDTGSYYEVFNKYSGEPLARVCRASSSDAFEAVDSAEKAFQNNKLTPLQRYYILEKTSEILLSQQEQLAMTIAREAGKPFKEALAEVSRAANTFRISAEEAKRIKGEVVPLSTTGSENRFAYTVRVPLGVVCAISPFNFPLNLVAHKVAPAIAAGNTVVLKPASATPISSLNLCRIMEEAGLPPGHLNAITGAGSEIGEALLDEPRFAYYTFTGSPTVGKQIRNRIGLRKCTLEMGSNSATIVHSDADLEKAAAACGRMAFANAGQVCISVQRIMVQKDVVKQFTELLVRQAEKLVLGDPADPKTDVGPMISVRDAERAEKWIAEAVSGGARVLTGGSRTGPLLKPTVLTGVNNSMKVVCEEIFAPVVSISTFNTFEEALKMVNDSKYGLQAGVYTGSISLAMQAVQELEVGGVMINDTSVFRVDEMPYGGVKESGVGREGPRYAIEEMTEPKLVVLNI